MRKTPSVYQACARGCYIQCDQASEGPADASNSSLALRNRAQPPASSTPMPGSQGQRWSADFSGPCPSSVIVVKKKRMRPKPPQRSVSLPQPASTSRPAFKRYSWTPTRPRRPSNCLYSSSSSSSLSSSCSCSSLSPLPAVPTSVITGPDPQGWKLQPKSSSASRRTKRLSLQIPLQLVLPQPETNPTSGSLITETPPLRVEAPHRRRYSDSSAFLGCRAVLMPAVTRDELNAARLSLTAPPHELDDVFQEGTAGTLRVASPPRWQKIAPAVAEKTPEARQKAKLIAGSGRSCRATGEDIYACVVKPLANPSHQTEKLVNLQQRFTGKSFIHCLY